MSEKFLIHKKCNNSDIVCVCMTIIQKNICQDATLCAILAMSRVSKLCFTFYQEKTPHKRNLV